MTDRLLQLRSGYQVGVVADECLSVQLMTNTPLPAHVIPELVGTYVLNTPIDLKLAEKLHAELGRQIDLLKERQAATGKNVPSQIFVPGMEGM